MSVATLTGGAPPLEELVDGLATRTGAWVLVEQAGRVVAHGAGTAECPAPLAEALLTRRTAGLRRAVTWRRGGGPLVGTVDGLPVAAAELGEGTTAWFVCGTADEAVLPLLAAAAHGTDQPVTDPVIEELLHPRGPARRRDVPAGRVVVLRPDGPAGPLARRAAALLAGTGARVHTDSDTVVVALPQGIDVVALVEQLRGSCPGATAGAADAGANAQEWAAAARLAAATAGVASVLGRPLAEPADPAVAAELVVREAHEAVGDLVRTLPATPLRRLLEHDARTGGDLVPSLRAWCRAAFDVPAAAAALHVHPNTLRYRIKRATELSGLDPARPRELLALQLLLEV